MKLSITFTLAAASSVSAFTSPLTSTRRHTPLRVAAAAEEILADDATTGAKAGQAEVVLVGCGAPNRGMGWYHAIQMLEGR